MKDIEFIVEHNIALSPKIIELKLHSDEILPPMKAGQFLHLEVKEASMPRCHTSFQYYKDRTLL